MLYAVDVSKTYSRLYVFYLDRDTKQHCKKHQAIPPHRAARHVVPLLVLYACGDGGRRRKEEGGEFKNVQGTFMWHH